jgi:GT2 family glycosyltransferase
VAAADPGVSTPAPPTAVIVLHWGVEADTIACLRSIAASGFAARPLLLIDNGTGAPSDAAIARAAPGAEIVRLPQNLGYTGGNNVGIRRALAGGAEYVVLVNNDAEVAPDCLATLVRIAGECGPRLGAVGAKVLSASDPSRVWMAWGRLTYRAALVERVGHGEVDDARFHARQDVDWVSGCAVLLTRSALEDVGLFDEFFFAYHEDVDWCTAARARGYRVVFAPEARVTHHGGGSAAASGTGDGGAVRYLCARNTVLFARKHAGVLDWLRLGVTIGGSLPLAYLGMRRRGHGRRIRDLVGGYRDGFLRREIPYAKLGLR